MENIIKRSIALMIDSAIVKLISGFFTGGIIGAFSLNYNPFTVSYGIVFTLFFVYFFFFDITNNGQTVGKALLDIQVDSMGLRQRFARSAYKMLSIILTPIVLIIYLTKGTILHETLMKRHVHFS